MAQIRRLFQEAAQALLALLRPAGRSVKANAGLAVLSVVLAFGTWVFVTDTENPTRTGVLPIELAVEPVNVPADVALANEMGSVRVKVRVADDVWDSLTAADFEATVDLSGLQVGIYDLPVQVRALTGRGGLSISEVIPREVEVDLAALISKSVPVTVDVTGSPPAGFTMSAPQTEDETAVVTGPQEKVSLVSQAVASLDVDGRTEAVQQAVRLEPRDQRGFLVQGVSVGPSVTDVSIQIKQTEFSRVMVVSPEIRGEPAEGYNVVGVTASPTTVTVFGPEGFAEGAAFIRTQPVDISDATSDVVRSVSLDLPRGASVSGGVSVTVTVRIEAGTGQLTFGVTPTAANLEPGLSVEGALPVVQVTLLGPLPQLLDLRTNDIAATVELAGLEAGSHKVSVTVSAPAGLLVTAVSPENVTVQLVER